MSVGCRWSASVRRRLPAWQATRYVRPAWLARHSRYRRRPCNRDRHDQSPHLRLQVRHDQDNPCPRRLKNFSRSSSSSPHLHRTRYIPRTPTLTQTRTTPTLKPHIRLARRLREQHWRRRLDRTFEAPCWLYAVTPPASDTSLRIRCWVPPGRKQRSHRRGHGLENSFLYSLKRLPMQGLVCCGM
jgi:hypothetical protein